MDSYNPINQDPLQSTSKFPAEDHFLHVRCENDSIWGTVRVADGEGPHPTVVFIHGFPGTEKNDDIAHALVRAGYNTVTFSHRGAWGSEGDYRFSHLIPDTGAVLHTLRERSAEFRIDTDRLCLLGYSMGGFTALQTGMIEKEVKHLISISGYNIGRFVQDVLTEDFLIDFCRTAWDAECVALNGVTGSILVDEAVENQAIWDTNNRIERLADKNILLIIGEDDHVVQPMIHHYPTVKALEEIETNLTTQELSAGHSYLGKRIELTTVVLSWLEENLK